jgi:hypothetical protein
MTPQNEGPSERPARNGPEINCNALDKPQFIDPPPAWQAQNFRNPRAVEAEFDVEIALALTASGWRVAAGLLTHAALLIEAGDFAGAERNRRQAREQFNAATDAFRQFQDARAATAAWIGAEAFLRAPP